MNVGNGPEHVKTERPVKKTPKIHFLSNQIAPRWKHRANPDFGEKEVQKYLP